MKPEEKKCGESCGCDATKNTQKSPEVKSETAKIPEKEEIKLDPTHFGDWQINGRAIDF